MPQGLMILELLLKAAREDFQPLASIPDLLLQLRSGKPHLASPWTPAATQQGIDRAPPAVILGPSASREL
eukprot:11226054-Lingulodinium_polyedra.AAC.1